MFSELPKLFDRNFAIAYILPVSLFLAASAALLNMTGYATWITSHLTGNLVFDVTLWIFIAWIIGILLMVLNADIYRILEGYGKFNPLRFFDRTARTEFLEKTARLEWLNDEYYKPTFTEALRKERLNRMEELAQRYPDQEAFVLPTAFGNALRAFETYPRVMYGFEAIDGWPRILAVIPKEYRELIDDAKAHVDWWVNLGVLSLLLLLEYWVVVFHRWGFSLPWGFTLLNMFGPLVVFSLLNWFFFWRATSAVIGWGDYVKSAFDLYRFKLLESLHIDVPVTRKAEKELWTKISQAVIFRSPDQLPKLKK